MSQKEFFGEDLLGEELSTKIKTEVEEYKRFAFKGEMLQLAIAFILGAAFNSVVKGISEHLIMPIVGFFTGAVAGGGWRTLTWEPIQGIVFETGAFAGCFVDFFVISLVLFILYVKVLKPYLMEQGKIIEEDEPKDDGIRILNWTSKEELVAIKGIGEKTADRIVEGYPYDDLEQIKDKADLSSSIMAKLKKWIDKQQREEVDG